LNVVHIDTVNAKWDWTGPTFSKLLGKISYLRKIMGKYLAKH